MTPPPELFHDLCSKPWTWQDRLELAYQAGADAELEACCEWLVSEGWFKYEHEAVEDLRAARRPKPPSLKEQALMHFQSFAATFETSGGDSDLIRRALEQLPDYTNEEL